MWAGSGSSLYLWWRQTREKRADFICLLSGPSPTGWRGDSLPMKVQERRRKKRPDARSRSILSEESLASLREKWGLSLVHKSTKGT